MSIIFWHFVSPTIKVRENPSFSWGTLNRGSYTGTTSLEAKGHLLGSCNCIILLNQVASHVLRMMTLYIVFIPKPFPPPVLEIWDPPCFSHLSPPASNPSPVPVHGTQTWVSFYSSMLHLGQNFPSSGFSIKFCSGCTVSSLFSSNPPTTLYSGWSF